MRRTSLEAMQSPIEFLCNPPHVAKTYGYVAMTKRAAGMLKVINKFNTFAEIREDLEAITKSNWQVVLFKSDLDKKFPVVYKVIGNGFLEECE